MTGTEVIWAIWWDRSIWSHLEGPTGSELGDGVLVVAPIERVAARRGNALLLLLIEGQREFALGLFLPRGP